ncbi:hypothetical protein Syun_027041 [Stephania yunnanensis]|uniref:Uncharacterized protein n=1 Tax=Stephania yunnanensis TaxID=152371 RepID=A0AAP0HQX9_9MAGN
MQAKLQGRRQELTQTTPDRSVDDEAVYYKVAGECPKGRVYNLRSLGRKKRRYVDTDASTSQENKCEEGVDWRDGGGVEAKGGAVRPIERRRQRRGEKEVMGANDEEKGDGDGLVVAAARRGGRQWLQ